MVPPLRAGVCEARQVSRARARAQLVQEVVAALIAVQLAHARGGIVQVPEDDGVGGAGLLAGRQHLAVADAPLLHARLDARALDALHAVGALLHDAAGAHRDVGIEDHLLGVAVVGGIAEKIEPPHLVWAVVGAVARAHAAVVDHLVEALVAVDGGVDGADVLAGSALAVHAHKRLEDHAGVGGIVADEIAVDAQPVHLAAAPDALLADDGNIVLRLARHHARAAAGAAREIDGHSPAISLRVIPRLVDGERDAALLLELLLRLAQLIERAGDCDDAALHRMVLLRL